VHPGHWVNAKDSISDNRGTKRCESMSAGTRDSCKSIGCYACSNFGHVTEACTITDGFGWRRISSGNGRGFTEAAPLDPGSNGRLYRASDHSIQYGHIVSR
jgi:hypothetical protein